MRKIIKDRRIGEKCRIRTNLVLFLLGFLLLNAQSASAHTPEPCDEGQYYPVSSLLAQMRDADNTFYGWGEFYISRNGEQDISVQLTMPQPIGANNVLKLYLRGVEIATMFRAVASNGSEHWGWGIITETPEQRARVGDAVTVTKNGQPFLSGTFTRYSYSWAYALGFAHHDVGEQTLCSFSWGYVYLPLSQYPRRMGVAPSVYTNSPVTRVTINGPSVVPGVPGPEIANVPIVGPINPSQPLPPGWRYTRAKNDNIQLSVIEYQQLQLGLLSVNVFTESSPNGFSQMPLTVSYINAGGDFEGDGQADFAVYRPSEQVWYVLFSSNNQFESVQFGLPSDKLVIGDYDHDGKSDMTAYQVDNPDYPGSGVWKIRRSTDDSTMTIQWGLSDDIPLSMDIDGNNTSDLVVFRPSTGTWYVQKMGDIIKPRTETSQSNSRFRTIRWGLAGDKPLAGDFDGDLRDEIAVFRPSEGNWYIYDDDDQSYRIIHWGLAGDIPMARDFDGDARADIAVYRPSSGTWYILSSIDDSAIIRQFGLSEDIPVPSDFDKDGVSDIAVFRPSDGTWYVTRSSDNTFYAAQFGASGDIPAMAYR